MRTLTKSISVGILGEVWASETCDLIKFSQVCDHVSVFEYPGREALFIDQYTFFIVTDFGTDPTSGCVQERLTKLNEMREIIASRSMRTVMLVNDDDADVSTSAREACCRLVRVHCDFSKRIPQTFFNHLLNELRPHILGDDRFSSVNSQYFAA